MVATTVRGADVLAHLDRPLRDHARDRGADDGVAELLEREGVGGPAVLELGLGRADRVERGLVAGRGHLVPGFRGLQHLGRRDAAGSRAPSPARTPARASSRFAVAVLTTAISASGGGASAASTGPLMPSCARVWSSAASARSRASFSSRGSISTSGVPTPTSRPISTSTRRTTPSASALTLAWSGESSVPARSIRRWTDIRWTSVVWTAHAARPPAPRPFGTASAGQVRGQRRRSGDKRQDLPCRTGAKRAVRRAGGTQGRAAGQEHERQSSDRPSERDGRAAGAAGIVLLTTQIRHPFRGPGGDYSREPRRDSRASGSRTNRRGLTNGAIMSPAWPRVLMPFLVYLVPLLRLLPVSAFDAVAGVLGVNASMDHFRGRTSSM